MKFQLETLFWRLSEICRWTGRILSSGADISLGSANAEALFTHLSKRVIDTLDPAALVFHKHAAADNQLMSNNRFAFDLVRYQY